MFALRFIALAFLAAYSFAMGQAPASDLNDFGRAAASSFLLWAPALYLLPTFEAWLRGHLNLGAIAAVNVFTGWTLVGWVVSLAWALKRPETVAPAPAPMVSSSVEPARPTRACPHCAETILAAAVKCKHCGSPVQATP